jgi:Holliday junction resolvase RusA-like endonuclease
MIELQLPFPPSTNNLFLNREHGRAPTRDYKLWQTEAGWKLNGQKQKPINGPVAVFCTFQEGRKADLDNLSKAVLDLLVEHQLIEGDGPSIVKSISLAFSEQVKGVRVRVTPFAIRAS